MNTRNIIPVVIGFLLCSCAWSTGNLKILNPTIIHAFRPGSTTMATVEGSLGPPDTKVRRAANEETWEYSHTSYSVIGAYWEMQTNILIIHFSQDGKVKDIRHEYMGYEGISIWPSARERK
jgi:SmpA / OmlA family